MFLGGEVDAESLRQGGAIRLWAGVFAYLSLAQGALGASGRLFLYEIRSSAQFAELAGAPYSGVYDKRPAVLFAVDRASEPSVYYANTGLFRSHMDFLGEIFLSQERGNLLRWNEAYGSAPRFYLGELRKPERPGPYVLRWWNRQEDEHPLRDARGEAQALDRLRRTFFAPIKVEAAAPVETGRRPSTLRPGAVVGRLRVLEVFDRETSVDPADIIAVRRVPMHAVPMGRGLIFGGDLSPLAHVAILAHSLQIPVAAGYESFDELRKWNGLWVRLEAAADNVTLRPATSAERASAGGAAAPGLLISLPADMEWPELAALQDQRGADWIRYGSKSANLGELSPSRADGFFVPPGFTIPFRYYAEFIRANGLELPIQNLLSDAVLRRDARRRALALESLRAGFRGGKIPDPLARAVESRLRGEFEGKGVFVRSSSNMEDLPRVSAAGIYATVPNVRRPEAVLEAVKEVWASVWSDAAFALRERLGVMHASNCMAVLIQEAVEADCAGVALTKDPRDPARRNAVFIAAKRGLGGRVVEGHELPEQLLYDGSSDSLELLNRSEDGVRLAFAAEGGLRAMPAPSGMVVLSHARARKLGRTALRIQEMFGASQDIEWAFRGRRLFILQSREAR